MEAKTYVCLRRGGNLAPVPMKKLLFFYNNPSVSLARATSLYTKEAFLRDTMRMIVWRSANRERYTYSAPRDPSLTLEDDKRGGGSLWRVCLPWRRRHFVCDTMRKVILFGANIRGLLPPQAVPLPPGGRQKCTSIYV